MRGSRLKRGMALVTVMLASILLLVLVGVLIDLGTVQLQRATADLYSLQALAGADAGASWVRGVLATEQGDVAAAVAKLGQVQGKRRFDLDSRTYVIASVTLVTSAQSLNGDHYDQNLESNANAVEQPVQAQVSATVFTDGRQVGHRSTTTLLRAFPKAPFSAVVGFIDDGGPVGIDSPGDAGGQVATQDATELLVHAYTIDPAGQHHSADSYGSMTWSDGNTQGPGPLP